MPGPSCCGRSVRRTGLFDAINEAIPDPRNPVFIVHDQRSMIAQRIVAIALGYEDLNDHQTLRADPALQLAAGRVPDEELTLASPPTLCRLENRIERKTLIRIAEVFVDQFIASHAQPPEHLILDFDATDDPVHGHQEGRFFHGYYDNYCFLPLYVFCGDELLAAYLQTQQDRRQQAQPGTAEAAGPAAPPGLARRQDHDPGRQRLLPLEADAVVRFPRDRLRAGPGPQPGPGTLGRRLDRAGRTPVPDRRASRSGSSARSPTRPRAGTDRGE